MESHQDINFIRLPIYRGRYLESYQQQSYLFEPTPWTTADRRLSNERIKEAQSGARPAGYFGTGTTTFFCLDVDHHGGEAWQGDEPSGGLAYNYGRAVKAMGVNPSEVFRTPRGLHPYYHLSERLPSGIISPLVTSRLAGAAEVLPSVSCGLRIPVSSCRLDPVTLLPADYSATVYHPAVLFDDTYTPASIKNFDKRGRFKYSTLKMVEIENRYLPEMGRTNQPLVVLGAAYKAAGLSLDAAVQRFSWLLQSQGYQGELLSHRRLYGRMASIYRRTHDSAPITIPDPGPRLFDEPIIAHLVERSPFARQRNEPLRRFVRGILEWQARIDAVYQDPTSCAVWDYIYPYFRVNIRRGYYPLPKSVLVRLNDRYNELMPFLLDQGLLERAPFGYSSRLGVCAHYSIRTEGIC